MRRALHLLLLFIAAAVGTKPASADQLYMVLEQDPSGLTSHMALDRSFLGDDIAPLLAFTALHSPTDPDTAQILWAASDAPVLWRRGAKDNTFHFVEYAIVPEGGQIQYRIYLHKLDIELGKHRHARFPNAPNWSVDPNVFDKLTPGEYYVEARLIVPGRPNQRLIQRVNVVDQAVDPDPDPDPTPNPDPDPKPDYEGPIGGNVDPLALAFTPLVPDLETRIIYVSDSQGNDNNDGLTPQTAVKTLGRGTALIRAGKPDWLLLKCGDTWEDQSFEDVQVGGAGVDKPMVFSTYGTGARPRIIPPHNKHGFENVNQQIAGLVIQGLHFWGATRDPGSNRYVGRPGDIDGINIRINSSNGKYIEGLVIEDCIITHFDNNILLVDDIGRVRGDGIPGRLQATIRRNIIRYASSDDSHAVGIYLEGTRDTLVEENLIDHNGWAQTDGYEQRNKRSHNIYVQTKNGPMTIRYNIISRGAAHGLQLRSGGVIEHNLFVRNALAFYTAINDSKANYNVVLESDDINPNVGEDHRGYGINGWEMDSYEVIGNIVARRVGALQKEGIGVSAKKLTVKNNIVYDWQDERTKESIKFSGDGAGVSGNKAKEYFNGVEPNYLDPSRGVDSYAQSISLDPTLDAFMNYAAGRPRGVWVKKTSADAVNNYVREGFQIVE